MTWPQESVKAVNKRIPTLLSGVQISLHRTVHAGSVLIGRTGPLRVFARVLWVGLIYRKVTAPSSASIHVVHFPVENRGMISVLETSGKGRLLNEFLFCLMIKVHLAFDFILV